MADASAWMPLYVGDYLGDTQRLTTEQHGAYFLLLIDYWRNGPPPNDDAVLAQITRMERADWQRIKRTLLKFFDDQDGMLVHGRVERELENAKLNHDRRVERARKGATKRWEGHTVENARSNAPRSATSNPLSNASSNAAGKPQAMLDECSPPSPSSNDDKNPPLVPPLNGNPTKRTLRDGWVPELFGEGSEAAAIVAGWTDKELKHQLEAFADHHRAKGSKFADWQAAWGTWVRKSVTFESSRSTQGDRSAKGFDLVENINANPERWRGSG